jgi:hypothetical protein
MPHMLMSATLRQDADKVYRALRTPGVHTSLTPIVRALCATVCAQLDVELRLGRPLRPPPMPLHQAELRNSKKASDRGRYAPLSAMANPQSRKRLIGSAVIELEAINRAPAGDLPRLENCNGLLPCDAVIGWFVMAPAKLARRARLEREAVPV